MKWLLQRFAGGNVVVEIETGATKGATVGKNLYWPDGTVVTEAELTAGSGIPATPGTTITSWNLIFNIPQNVLALASQSGAGIFVLDGAGNSFVREVVSTDGSVTVTDGDGVAGNIDLSVDVSGGILPIVTGEILSGQPVFVIGPDGSLIYGPVI